MPTNHTFRNDPSCCRITLYNPIFFYEGGTRCNFYHCDQTAHVHELAKVDGCFVDSSSSVRNLGVLFDSNLSIDGHVSSIFKTEFFHLKILSKLRPMLSMSNAEMLINAFMTSRLDYCNDLLGGFSTDGPQCSS